MKENVPRKITIELLDNATWLVTVDRDGAIHEKKSHGLFALVIEKVCGLIRQQMEAGIEEALK